MATNQSNNHNYQSTPRMSGMDYLNSISAPSQPAGSHSNTAPGGNKKGLLMFMIASVALIIALVVAIAVVIGNRTGHDTPENPDDDDVVTVEDHEQVETLNETLASLIETNPYHDYSSQNKQSYSYYTTPSEIIDEFGLNVDDLDYSAADSILAMNSNILNYYLDQGAIVIIVDSSEITVQEDKKTDTLIVYGSAPSEFDFVSFVPSDFNADGTRKDSWLFPEQTAVYLSRSELFNQLSESAKFYVINK